ncbi:hypothetical protein F5Y19DRAFT_491107 [Xylariaceae sp. FL1651]|nr:hypothetical protein F5Y19DRAFT_491107 [Xylariaceae sp. FL1651]
MDEVHPLRDIDRFEAAGRGAWGALKLLCERPTNILTSFGAAITVPSLHIDPFSRQVLNFYSCPQPTEELRISIQRGRRSTKWQDDCGSLYQGFLSPSANVSSTIPTSCPSGSCTFVGIYSSLAICSSVHDISDQIAGSGGFIRWGYFRPSNVSIGGNYVLTTAPVNGNLGSYSEDKPMFSMEILMVNLVCNDDGETTISESRCSTSPRAFHVTFSPCIHTYSNSSYSNAIFNDHLASTDMLALVQFPGYYSLAGNFPSSPSVDCTLARAPQGRKVQPTSLFMNGMRYANRWHNASEEPDVLYLDQECTYDFGYGPAQALTKSLGSVFGGTADVPNNLVTPRGVPPGISSDMAGGGWLKTLRANGAADIASVTRYMDGRAVPEGSHGKRDVRGSRLGVARPTGRSAIIHVCFRPGHRRLVGAIHGAGVCAGRTKAVEAVDATTNMVWGGRLDEVSISMLERDQGYGDERRQGQGSAEEDRWGRKAGTG